MDIIRPFVRHFTRDLYWRRDGFRPRRYRKLLARTQYLSSDEIAALQLAKLREIIRTAWDHNAFYRDRFAEVGLHPDDVRSFSDVSALPLLTKDDIRTALVHSFTTGYSADTTYPRRTGGSTGVPLLVYHDYEAASVKRAAEQRHNGWADWQVGDRVACVWGDCPAPGSWKMRLRNALSLRATFLDTLRFDSPHLDRFIREIRRTHPRVLFGHAHSIYRFAEYVRERAERSVSFRSVVTTSMVLSPGERRVIEGTFGADVYDRYGCHETSIIASECPAHSGLHVFAEGLYLELLGSPGDAARKIVLTDLVNRAMPLIRYDVGDYGVAARGLCPCGRALPRLEAIAGRTADFLYTPDRVPVFGLSVLDTFVIHIPGIKQLQIYQDEYDKLEFHLVRDDLFSEDTLALLRMQVRKVFGDRMRYKVRFVDSIAQTERGKYRFSICRIPGAGPDAGTAPLETQACAETGVP